MLCRQHLEEQDRRFRDPPLIGGAPPPGAGSRSVAGGKVSHNRDSNWWGNSLSQWDLSRVTFLLRTSYSSSELPVHVCSPTLFLCCADFII